MKETAPDVGIIHTWTAFVDVSNPALPPGGT
jgi:hypothetical protein